MIKEICWDALKSERLKKVRGVSFEEIINAKLVAVMEHPRKLHQNILLFEYRRYLWVVPYVADRERIFLKTLYPSRKFTKLFRKGYRDEKDQIK